MLVDLSKSLSTILPVPEGEMRPVWSVMIPCYNDAGHLKEALESILKQYPGRDKMQIMVVDDHSTIGDPESLVKEIGKGEISFYRQPVNVGHSKNYDTCVKLAKGKFIHILHQDDRIRNGFYEKMLNIFTKFPNIGAAFCRHIFIDENGNWLSISELEREDDGVLDKWLTKIAERQRIQYCSMVVKREVYENLGGFINSEIAGDGWQMAGEDWEMWVRISASYDVGYVTEPLAEYRIHKSSMTSGLFRSGANITDLQKIIERVSQFIPDNIKEEVKKAGEKHFSNYAFEVARTLVKNSGDEEAARAQLNEAIKLNKGVIPSEIELHVKLNELIERPGVSIVIHSHSGASRLSKVLQNISEQEIPDHIPFEIIVIDNNTSINGQILKDKITDNRFKNASIRVIHEPVSGINAARLAGLAEAKYEFILLCDDNTLLDADYVLKGFDTLNNHRDYGALFGSGEIISDKEIPYWLNADLISKSFGIGEHTDTKEEFTDSQKFQTLNGVFLRKGAWKKITANKISLNENIDHKNYSNKGNELFRSLSESGWKIYFDPMLRIRQFIPPFKMKWKYLRTLWRKSGEHFAGAGKKNAYDIRRMLRSLRKHHFKKLATLTKLHEGDNEIIYIEYNLGKLNSLLKQKTLSSRKQIRLLKRSSRKRDRAYLRRLYSDFERKIKQKGVSVVICCYNSSKLLPETLRHLSLQKVRSYVNWEVIVVDNASTDNTGEVAMSEWNKYSGVKGNLRVVKQPIPGLSAAREKGIGESKYEYIIFCDDDNWLDSNYIQRVTEVMRMDNEIAIIGCKTEEVCEVNPPSWFEKWKNQSYAVGEQAESAKDVTWSRGFVWGAGMVLRREALNKLYAEGFKSILTDRKGKELASGGDTELCYGLRLIGWKIYYEPRLVLKHYLPKEKLNWIYLRQLWRDHGMKMRPLLNEKLIRSSEKKTNAYDIRRMLRSLSKHDFKKLATLTKLHEGDNAIIYIEYNLGKLNSLLKQKTLSSRKQIRLLKRSSRKRDRAYLRRLYSNFERKIKQKGVSVVICCYNSSKLLPETLRHLSLQKVRSYVNWEVIVVDNASTDNTGEVAMSEWNKYSGVKGNLRVVKQPIPGLSAAREKGIEESKYEYIIFCDDDNWLDSNYIQRVTEVMRMDKEIAIIGCKTEEICEVDPPSWFEKWKNWSYAVGEQVESAKDVTWSRGFVWGAGMVLRREALNKLYAEGFKSILTDRKGKELASGGDTELCFALRLAGWRIYYEPRLMLKHYMTAPRLKWEYLLKLWKGFGISTAGLDTYLNVIPPDMIEENYIQIKKSWKENVNDTLKRLRSIGIKKVLFRKNIEEGDPDLPIIVHDIARLKELFKIRSIYQKRSEDIKKADWKKQFYYLRIQNKRHKKSTAEVKTCWPWVLPPQPEDSNDRVINSSLKISVLTPSFNSEDHIEKAIVSVINQNYPNFEHIVVDAGSKDYTIDILKKYPHVKWISEPDEGQSDAMNKAFKMSKGDIICYLNADDYFEPQAFIKIINAFIKMPDADMIVGNLILDMKENSMVIYPETDYKKIMLPFRFSFPINPVSYFYKRKVQETVGNFPVENHYTMDYWFLLRAYKKFNIRKINEILGTFIFHETNKTAGADNARNTHLTVAEHLRESDFANKPYYFYNYYKNKLFTKKKYRSGQSVFRHVKYKNFQRIRFNKEYSQSIYERAKERCYNYSYLKGFILLNFSVLVYPLSAAQKSRQSLLIRTVLGHTLVEKLRKAYYRSIVKKYEITSALKKHVPVGMLPSFEKKPLPVEIRNKNIFSMYFSKNAIGYSETLFNSAWQSCYNYEYMKGLVLLAKSVFINPFSILQESRRSLLFRTVIGHSNVESLRKLYYGSASKTYKLNSVGFFWKLKNFFRNVYYFFRYRKFKVYSENYYTNSKDCYANKKMKSMCLLLFSLMLYPPSIIKRSRWSLMKLIIVGNGLSGKLKS